MTLPMLELLCFEAAEKGDNKISLSLSDEDFHILSKEIEDTYASTYLGTASYKLNQANPIRVHTYNFAGVTITITTHEVL